MTTATHMGTHMDSPSHFVPGGLDVDRIALEDFIAPAAVINIASRAAEESEASVTVQDLKDWERMTGQSLDGTVVLMNSGWGAKWEDRTQFIGTTEEDSSKLRFPGFSGEAAQWLVDHRNIKGVGVDTLSIDVGTSRDFPSHIAILSKGLYALENVANVDKIPAYGALLYVFPMKISRASGAPTRVVATYPKVIFQQ